MVHSHHRGFDWDLAICYLPECSCAPTSLANSSTLSRVARLRWCAPFCTLFCLITLCFSRPWVPSDGLQVIELSFPARIRFLPRSPSFQTLHGFRTVGKLTRIRNSSPASTMTCAIWQSRLLPSAWPWLSCVSPDCRRFLCTLYLAAFPTDFGKIFSRNSHRFPSLLTRVRYFVISSGLSIHKVSSPVGFLSQIGNQPGSKNAGNSLSAALYVFRWPCNPSNRTLTVCVMPTFMLALAKRLWFNSKRVG